MHPSQLAPARGTPVTPYPILPTEIVYIICDLTIHEYIASLLLGPKVSTEDWGSLDAFSILLHINLTFRSNAIKLIGCLLHGNLDTQDIGSANIFFFSRFTCADV